MLDEKLAATSYQPNYIKAGEPGSYIDYYLGASTETRSSRLWEQEPNKDTKKKGVVREEAFVPADSTFCLEITELRSISGIVRPIYDLALGCFLRFGSMGYRHTRCFGSWSCEELLSPLEETKKFFAPLLIQATPFFAEWTEGSVTKETVFNQVETRLRRR